MIKYFFIYTISFFCLTSVYAIDTDTLSSQSSNILNDTLISDTDTLSSKHLDDTNIDSLEVSDYVELDSLDLLRLDSLKEYPAYNVYNSWRTNSVHYKGVDLAKMKDTVCLHLSYDECDFSHPICGRITSNFGPRRGRFHYGVDIKLNIGDSVRSIFPGKVRFVGYSSGYGKLVLIRHHNGLETYYAHLSKYNVSKGDIVEAGDVIALGGNTGRSTGPHLHLELRYLGNAINPNSILNIKEGELNSTVFEINQKNFEYLVELRRRKYHTIRSGQTLSHVSARYGVSLSKIYKLNRLNSRSVIRVGQKIRYN